MKPDIVFFGEDLPQRFHSLQLRDFSKCDLLVVMGTSLEVYILYVHASSQTAVWQNVKTSLRLRVAWVLDSQYPARVQLPTRVGLCVSLFLLS